MQKSAIFILAAIVIVGFAAMHVSVVKADGKGSGSNDSGSGAQVCCKITPVLAPDVQVNSTYEFMNRGSCSNTINGEPIVGSNHEIVDNTYCLNASPDNKETETNDSSNNTIRERVRERVEVELEGHNITINGMTMEQARELLQERNRLRLHANSSDIPANCTRAGSTLKCTLNGTRTMTVTAGKSGNIIVQVQGVNMSTNVTLYKSNRTVYGIFGNETRVVRMPDAIRERIRERLQAQIQNESMHLGEDGNYSVNVTKQVRFLGLFPAQERVQMRINAQNGAVLQQHNPWWAFLASNVKDNVVGASCGTVTPGQNDACCQAKGLDYWNATSGECDFNSTTSS